MQFKNPEGQLARWLEVLSEYDMEIIHMPGNKHSNADALSRVPCKQCGYCSNWKNNISEETAMVRNISTDGYSNDLSNDEQLSLKELQDSDTSIQFIKRAFIDHKKPLFSEISGRSVATRCVWSQWDRLEVIDGILYRRFETTDTSKNHLQAIVPFAERRNVLFQCHDSKTSAHLGVRKTLEKIRQKYYWPGLQSDVRKYIAGCDFCNKRKAPLKNKKSPNESSAK
jgi:predicted nucleic-acid-binding Zn-ribbon protein